MKKAFTLIELLVVIAIIAILAAILFPVFEQAREKAFQTSCLSNLKQMGTSIILYKDDFDETFPPLINPAGIKVKGVAGYEAHPINALIKQVGHDYCIDIDISKSGFTEDGTGYFNWTDAIFPYVKNANMYVCPSNEDALGYGMNECMEEVVEAQIANSSETVLFADTWAEPKSLYNTVGYLVKYMMKDCPFGGVGTTYALSCIPWRHNSGSNYCMADGHAKFYKRYSGPTDGNCSNTGKWDYQTPDTGKKWWDPTIN